MKKLIAITIAIISIGSSAFAGNLLDEDYQNHYLTGPNGEDLGYTSHDGTGVYEFYGSKGQHQGSASPDGFGGYYFYDSTGRYQGRVSK